MAGSYYDQDRTKRLLGIATTDSADDTHLDELGLVADQHIENILRIHDEKIPLTGANILNDVKQAAAFYAAGLFKAGLEDKEMSDHWMKLFKETMDGIFKDRAIQGQPYMVERFNGKYVTGMEDVYALWY